MESYKNKNSTNEYPCTSYPHLPIANILLCYIWLHIMILYLEIIQYVFPKNRDSLSNNQLYNLLSKFQYYQLIH